MGLVPHKLLQNKAGKDGGYLPPAVSWIAVREASVWMPGVEETLYDVVSNTGALSVGKRRRTGSW